MLKKQQKPEQAEIQSWRIVSDRALFSVCSGITSDSFYLFRLHLADAAWWSSALGSELFSLACFDCHDLQRLSVNQKRLLTALTFLPGKTD